jgi:hypothetical protein
VDRDAGVVLAAGSYPGVLSTVVSETFSAVREDLSMHIHTHLLPCLAMTPTPAPSASSSSNNNNNNNNGKSVGGRHGFALALAHAAVERGLRMGLGPRDTAAVMVGPEEGGGSYFWESRASSR